MDIIKKTIPVGLIIAVTGAFPALSVQAEAIPASGPIPFAAFDMDANGQISEQEFNSVRGQRISTRTAAGELVSGASGSSPFSEIDLNADDQLSEEELAARRNSQMEKRRKMGMGPGSGMGQSRYMGQNRYMSHHRCMSQRGMEQGRGMGRNMPAFSEFDLDGDGKIPEKEFNEARAGRISERAKQGYSMRNIASAPPFSNIDTNGDGAISEEEFYSSQSLHRQQMQKRRVMRMQQGRAMHQGMGPAREMGRGMGRNKPAFSEFDLDGDGKMTEKEFNEARSKRISERARQGYQMRYISKAPSFSNIDTNGDAVISAEEFAQHQSRRRQ